MPPATARTPEREPNPRAGCPRATLPARAASRDVCNVQVLARRPFDPGAYQTPTAPGATTGTLTFAGSAQGPTELGRKETVRVNPSEVTWVIMRFDLPSVPFTRT